MDLPPGSPFLQSLEMPQKSFNRPRRHFLLGPALRRALNKHGKPARGRGAQRINHRAEARRHSCLATCRPQGPRVGQSPRVALNKKEKRRNPRDGCGGGGGKCNASRTNVATLFREDLRVEGAMGAHVEFQQSVVHEWPGMRLSCCAQGYLLFPGMSSRSRTVASQCVFHSPSCSFSSPLFFVMITSKGGMKKITDKRTHTHAAENRKRRCAFRPACRIPMWRRPY